MLTRRSPARQPLCPAATAFWLRTYLVNTATGAWTEQGAAAEISRDDTTVVRTLPAGVYRFAMFANNTNGDGPDSDLTDPVIVGKWLVCKGICTCGLPSNVWRGRQPVIEPLVPNFSI